MKTFWLYNGRGEQIYATSPLPPHIQFMIPANFHCAAIVLWHTTSKSPRICILFFLYMCKFDPMTNTNWACMSSFFRYHFVPADIRCFSIYHIKRIVHAFSLTQRLAYTLTIRLLTFIQFNLGPFRCMSVCVCAHQ